MLLGSQTRLKVEMSTACFFKTSANRLTRKEYEWVLNLLENLENLFAFVSNVTLVKQPNYKPIFKVKDLEKEMFPPLLQDS